MDQTTGCLKSRGTGAAVNSTLASRSPVKFQEPAIHIPSLPAMKASRQLAFDGGAILSAKRLAQNSATSTAAESARAERLRSGVKTLAPFCQSRLWKPQVERAGATRP